MHRVAPTSCTSEEPTATNIEVPAADVQRQFRTAMRRQACTVAIVTIGDKTGPRALIATSVTPVSMDPPALLFCVNRTASIHAIATVTARFCISLLWSGDVEIAKHFNASKGRNRFQSGDWKYDEHGTPWLSSAQASIFGTIFSVVECYSHSTVFGHVTSATAATEISPLLYADGRYGTLQHFSAT